MADVKPMATFLAERVQVLVGDITEQRVDAIVNAANFSLMGGGGVDGAIHFKGGPEILAECKQVRKTRFPSGLPTGEAVITTGGNLPARYVIHTVGPVTRLGQQPDAAQLGACYRNSLGVANEYALKTIAFPAISTGAFGYPREEAAAVASRAIEDALGRKISVERVSLVFFAIEDVFVFLKHHKFSSKP